MSASSASAGAQTAATTVGGPESPTKLVSWSGPASNDTIAIAFAQSIGASDALRTGAYSKTFMLTLSTTQP